MSYVDTRAPEAFTDENKERVKKFLKELGRLSRKHGLYLSGQPGSINGDTPLRVLSTKLNTVLEDEVQFTDVHEYE